MTRVAVVDYGAGNLRSVENVLSFLGVTAMRVSDPELLHKADRIILPGVGGASSAMKALRERCLDDALRDVVRLRGRPFLGICLGMQLIADRLVEFGDTRGLGWIPGNVVSIKDLVNQEIIVPHMGWNEVAFSESAKVFQQGSKTQPFYFCHSYALDTPDSDCVAGVVHYSVDLVAAVMKDTVFAVQFHPEKSLRGGIELIRKFLAWQP